MCRRPLSVQAYSGVMFRCRTWELSSQSRLPRSGTGAAHLPTTILLGDPLDLRPQPLETLGAQQLLKVPTSAEVSPGAIPWRSVGAAGRSDRPEPLLGDEPIRRQVPDLIPLRKAPPSPFLPLAYDRPANSLGPPNFVLQLIEQDPSTLRVGFLGGSIGDRRPPICPTSASAGSHVAS